MADNRLEAFVSELEGSIRKLIFSYMILGRFPPDWSFESYNNYLERRGCRLSCMLFCFGGKEAESIQPQRLEKIVAALSPGLCVKAYGDFLVCLAFEQGPEDEALSPRIAACIAHCLPHARVREFSSDRISNLFELVGTYQKLCALAEADMVQFDRGEHILRLYTLEEELLDSILVCEKDNINFALEEIADLIDRTNKHDLVADQSYFSFLWRHIDRVIYRRTGLRATTADKYTMDRELHSASELSDAISILRHFIFHYIETVGLDKSSGFSGSCHRIISRAREFVVENCSEDLSLERVSREVGLSSFYLSKLFKKEVGLNYKEFVIKVRMEKAHSLICSEGYTVSEAARAVGYNNLNYFGKAFKNYFGITARDLKLNK